MKSNLFLVVLSIFSLQNIHCQYTDVINTNRPGLSAGAFSVGKRVLQIESGLNFRYENHDLLYYTATGVTADVIARYGYFKEELEFIANLGYQNDLYQTAFLDKRRSSLNSVGVGVKYLIYDPNKGYVEKIDLMSYHNNHKFKWRTLRPAVSLFVGTNFNLGSNNFISDLEKEKLISPKVVLITQNNLNSGINIVTNIFYEKIATPYSSYGYVITFTKAFNEKWSAFLENKGIIGEYYSDGIITGGAAYLLDKNIQFDVSIGTNIKTTPQLYFGGIGFSWRDDSKHKENRVYKDEKKSKKGKKGKKEKKDKTESESSKRKDQVPTEAPIQTPAPN